MLSLCTQVQSRRLGVRFLTTKAPKEKSPYIRLKVREKAAEMIPKYQHPWVYGASLSAKVAENPPAAGSIVDLVDSYGRFLCRGTYSPESRMSVRVLTYDQTELIDATFWRRKIRQSLDRRVSGLPSLDLSQTNAFRVINAESDGIPGLVVDKYADWYTVQMQNAGLETHRNEVIDALVDVLKPGSKGGIYERSDEANRQKDGLPFRKGVLHPLGGKVPDLIEVVECGRKMMVSLAKGHKTGFYLDQRDNRTLLGTFCNGKRVLNCFSYSGGFAIAALKNGARFVANVDSSSEALELSKLNMELNGFTDSTQFSHEEANVFEYLRGLDESNAEKFDVIVLDPPKFASSAGNVESAAKGYKDINRLALKLLKPKTGILATFSCSGLVDTTLWRQIISSACVEAERPAQIIHTLGHPPDHPISTAFPEAQYLKGYILKTM